MKIPKIIHYVWVGDPNKKTQQFYDCLASWKKYCPDYKIIEWNESNFDINASIYAKQALEVKKYGFVADFVRTQVLYEHGGIYLDTDVEITKSFDDLLDNDFLISFENDVYLETAILASKKGHPLPKMMMEFYHKYPFLYKGKPDTTPNTPIWTCFLKNYYGLNLKNHTQILNNLDNPKSPTVTVLPNEYFCPINYTTKELNKTENTYAIHYFGATWFTDKQKKREKFLKGVYKFFGKKIFAGFTKIYVSHVDKKLKKRIKKYDIKFSN